MMIPEPPVLTRELADIDPETMSIRFKFADGNDRDEANDLVNVEGIDTSLHKKNPIVVFNDQVVGLCEDHEGNYTVEIDKAKKQAWCRVYFYAGEGFLGDAGQSIFYAVAGGLIRGASYNGRIIESEPHYEPSEYDDVTEGRTINRFKLLSVRLSGLPMSFSTIRTGFARGKWVY